MKEKQDKIEELYRKRAKHLLNRQEFEKDLEEEKSLSIITFFLGQDLYALEISQIAEIVPMGNLTRIPGATSEIKGITNLRGEPRLVMDLCHLLHLPLAESQQEGLSYILFPTREISSYGVKIGQVKKIISVVESKSIEIRSERGDSAEIKGLIPEHHCILLNFKNIFMNYEASLERN